MRPEGPGRRAVGALLVAGVVLAAVAVWPEDGPASDARPNVIVVLTDDQPADALSAMPWLGAQLAFEDSGWSEFPPTVANTPL
ncbi:MAG TPA: hypothetical protein VFP13_00425, partial [Actinomycetota bacterium]|nr:hypothetical protein [Actinomycetota bacterium]